MYKRQVQNIADTYCGGFPGLLSVSSSFHLLFHTNNSKIIGPKKRQITICNATRQTKINTHLIWKFSCSGKLYLQILIKHIHFKENILLKNILSLK